MKISLRFAPPTETSFTNGRRFGTIVVVVTNSEVALGGLAGVIGPKAILSSQ
jgi:hypothetical protein